MSGSSDYTIASLGSSQTHASKGTLTKKPNPRARKCTLTQQQRNQKRQRATPEQLRELNDFFSSVSSTPTAEQRRIIGENIDMTPRSVQIWFQNKRAKTKKAKKHVDVFLDGSEAYLGRNLMLSTNGYYALSNPSLTSLSAGYSSARSTPVSGRGTITAENNSGTGTENESSTTDLAQQHYPLSEDFLPNLYIAFPCTSLIMGIWKQDNMPTEEVTVTYQPEEQNLIYMISNGSRVTKVVIPFRIVENLGFYADKRNPAMGHISVTLKGIPQFYERVTVGKKNQWNVCEDFTGSNHSCHNIEGPYDLLQQQLHRLYSFQPSKVSQQLFTSPPLSGTVNKSSDDKSFLEVDIAAGMLLSTPSKQYSDGESPISLILPGTDSLSMYDTPTNSISLDVLLEIPALSVIDLSSSNSNFSSNVPSHLSSNLNSTLNTNSNSETSSRGTDPSESSTDKKLFSEVDLIDWARTSQGFCNNDPQQPLDYDNDEAHTNHIHSTTQGVDDMVHEKDVNDQGNDDNDDSAHMIQSPIQHENERQLDLSLKLGLELDLGSDYNNGHNYTVEPVDLMMNNGHHNKYGGDGGHLQYVSGDKYENSDINVNSKSGSNTLLDLNQFFGI